MYHLYIDMAHVIHEVKERLINHQIDCRNNSHIGGLSWLIQNHPDPHIRRMATIALIRCFKGQSGGDSNYKTMIRRIRKYYQDLVFGENHQ